MAETMEILSIIEVFEDDISMGFIQELDTNDWMQSEFTSEPSKAERFSKYEVERLKEVIEDVDYRIEVSYALE